MRAWTALAVAIAVTALLALACWAIADLPGSARATDDHGGPACAHPERMGTPATVLAAELLLTGAGFASAGAYVLVRMGRHRQGREP
ncbi:MAG TPA: hypothetical protein VN759_09760 [Pseudolysinimonas sp.]|nr:hypothetical protein [Pseudolysinimonas sp.]